MEPSAHDAAPLVVDVLREHIGNHLTEVGDISNFRLVCRAWKDCAVFPKVSISSHSAPEVLSFRFANAATFWRINSLSEIERIATLLTSEETSRVSCVEVSECSAEECATLSKIGFMHNPLLKCLRIPFCRLTDSELGNFVKACGFAPNLSELDVSGNTVGPELLSELVSLLSDSNHSLKGLNMRSCRFPQASSACDVAAALKSNRTLLSLNMNEVRCTDSALGTAFAEALRINSTLTFLDLVDNDLTAETASDLFQALLVNRTLKSLRLETRPVGSPAPMIALAEVIRTNPVLQSLAVKRCLVIERDPFILFLNAVEKSETLLSLQMSHTFFPVMPNFDFIAKNKSLRVLNLFACNLMNQGCAVVKALKASPAPLEMINLAQNQLQQTCVYPMTRLIEKKRATLKKFNFHLNPLLGEPGITAIRDAARLHGIKV